MARATEDKLGNLHDRVATVMIGALNRAEDRANDTDLEEGDFPTEVNPALLGAITKFLKDNDITVQADTGSSTDTLRERLRARKSVGNVTHLG